MNLLLCGWLAGWTAKAVVAPLPERQIEHWLLANAVIALMESFAFFFFLLLLLALYFSSAQLSSVWFTSIQLSEQSIELTVEL